MIRPTRLPWTMAAIAIAWAAGLAWWTRSTPTSLLYPKVDTISFVTGALAAKDGQWDSLYSRRLQVVEVESSRATGALPNAPTAFTITRVLPGQPFSRLAEQAGYRHEDPPVFVYLPAFAVLFRPLTLVPWSTAALILDFFGLLALAAIAGHLLLKLPAPQLTPQRTLLFLLASLAAITWMASTNFGLYCGQISSLIAGVCYFAMLPCRRPTARIAAGGLAGIAATMKLFPFLILGWFLLRRRWLEAATMTLMAVALAFGCGTGMLAEWRYAVADMARGAWLWQYNQSLDALLNRFFYSVNATQELGGFTPRPASLSALLLTLALVATWTARWARPLWRHNLTRTDSLLPPATAMLAIFAVAPPIAWTHYGAFLIPGLLVLALTAARRGLVHCLLAAALTLAAGFDPTIWRVAYAALLPYVPEAPLAIAYRIAVGLPAVAAVGLIIALLTIRPCHPELPE